MKQKTRHPSKNPYYSPALILSNPMSAGKETEAKVISCLENDFSDDTHTVNDRPDFKQIGKLSLNTSHHSVFVVRTLLFYYHFPHGVDVPSLILFSLRQPGWLRRSICFAKQVCL